MRVTVRLFDVVIPEVSPLAELGDLTAQIVGKNYIESLPFDALLPTLSREDLEKFGHRNSVVYGGNPKFITIALDEELVIVVGFGDHRTLLGKLNAERKAAYLPEISEHQVGGGRLRAGVELGGWSGGDFGRVLVLEDYSGAFGGATIDRQVQQVIKSKMLYHVYVDYNVYT